MILPASTEEGKLLKKRYAVFNFDGSFDANGDDVLPNVKVELYAGACPADLTTLTDRVRTTTTDVNGTYLFQAVPNGDYCVVSGGFENSQEVQGAAGYSVTVADDDTLTADFGFAPKAFIGDFVYIDSNLRFDIDFHKKTSFPSHVHKVI